MREIKFRAWDKLKKSVHEVAGINFVEGIVLLWKQTGTARQTYAVEVDSIELMQYTGLHDKNGTEIYEGDIVKTSYGDSVTVIWDNDEMLGDGTDEWCVGFRLPSFAEDCDVIGNIYENPQENTNA